MGVVERVRDEDLLDEPAPPRRVRGRGLGRPRQAAALAVAVLALPLLTLLLAAARDALSLESVVLLYLLVVVGLAFLGGAAVALVAAAASAVLINYYFVAPLHTFDVADADQALALAVFLAVAAVVSGAVEVAVRRTRAAEQSAAQAETLSALAGAHLDDASTLADVLERARATFRMESVVLRERDRATAAWTDVEHAGWAPRGE